MAGHSQYKNIMHRKGRQDKLRSNAFAKLGREITVAAKAGLPDPAMNSRLRLAVQNARAGNMPWDTIERAIKKASGAEGENFDSVRYEGYGPGGVAIVVEALTNNRNRTANILAKLFFIAAINRLMGITVTADLVTGDGNIPNQLGAPLGDPTEDKKRRPHVELLKHFEDTPGVMFDSQWITIPLVAIDHSGKGLDMKIVLHIHSHDIGNERFRHDDYCAPLPSNTTLRLSKIICKSNKTFICLM